MSSFSPSPGRGSYSNVQLFASSSAVTGGTPLKSTCQVGPTAKRQCSLCEESGAASSSSDWLTGRSEVNWYCASPAARPTVTRFWLTASPAVVTASSASNGSDTVNARDFGATRSTVV